MPQNKAVSFRSAERLTQLSLQPQTELESLKKNCLARGMDLIDLGIGTPDLPPPEFVIKVLEESLRSPAHQNAQSREGQAEFRKSAAAWMERRYGVRLNPDEEILPLIGSKEGIAHLPLAVVNKGDSVLVPDPSYPVYYAASLIAEARPYRMALLETNEYFPELGAIPREVLDKTKLMFLNYPSNPITKAGSSVFLKEAADFARRRGIVIAHDAAYADIHFSGERPASILESEEARDHCVEFHSLSKAFNLSGWRIGFAAGSAPILKELARLKSITDSGLFPAVLRAACAALDQGEKILGDTLALYSRRRALVSRRLSAMGWPFKEPEATFYYWLPVPPGYTSLELARMFMEQMGIIVVPGNVFGPNGEGYFRLALTAPDERLEEAMDRIEKTHKHEH